MRAVGVPLGLPRHLPRGGRGERAEIVRRHFAVEHLERLRERAAHARILRLVAAVIAGTQPIHDCPAGIGRQTARAAAAAESPPADVVAQRRVRVTLLLNTASICVVLFCLELQRRRCQE